MKVREYLLPTSLAAVAGLEIYYATWCSCLEILAGNGDTYFHPPQLNRERVKRRRAEWRW